MAHEHRLPCAELIEQRPQLTLTETGAQPAVGLHGHAQLRSHDLSRLLGTDQRAAHDDVWAHVVGIKEVTEALALPPALLGEGAQVVIADPVEGVSGVGVTKQVHTHLVTVVPSCRHGR